MQRAALLLTVALLFCRVLHAQENNFRITVLAYQWTTTHQTLTFSWPGHADTSCNGTVNVNGSTYGGNFSANGMSSSTCSTTYTPPSNQAIDVQKPVVFILAETSSARMVITCTRNVRWSQCNALNPGQFMARIDKGHLEVQATSGKGKEEWIKFDVIQQTAVAPKAAPAPVSASVIDAPKPAPTHALLVEYCQAHPDKYYSYAEGGGISCSDVLKQQVEAPKSDGLGERHCRVSYSLEINDFWETFHDSL